VETRQHVTDLCRKVIYDYCELRRTKRRESLVYTKSSLFLSTLEAVRSIQSHHATALMANVQFNGHPRSSRATGADQRLTLLSTAVAYLKPDAKRLMHRVERKTIIMSGTEFLS